MEGLAVLTAPTAATNVTARLVLQVQIARISPKIQTEMPTMIAPPMAAHLAPARMAEFVLMAFAAVPKATWAINAR